MKTEYHLREFLNKSLKKQQQTNQNEIDSSDNSENDDEIKNKNHNLKRIRFDPDKKRKFKKLMHSNDSDTSNTSDKQNSSHSKITLKLSQIVRNNKERKKVNFDSSYSSEEYEKLTKSRK